MGNANLSNGFSVPVVDTLFAKPILGKDVSTTGFPGASANLSDLTVRFGSATKDNQAQIVVTNQGNQKAQGQINITVYGSKDPFLNTSDPQLAALKKQAINLGVGQSQTYTINISKPKKIGGQDYYLLAAVDSQNAIKEINEGNNLATWNTAAPSIGVVNPTAGSLAKAAQPANTTLRRTTFWNNASTGDNVLWYTDDPAWAKGTDNNNLTGGIYEALPIQSDPTNWKFQTTGDFNGDGQTDILWRHQVTGAVQFWAMNGTTRTQTIDLSYALSDANWKIQGAGDFDGDGFDDIIWRNYAAVGTLDTGKNAVWTLQLNATTGKYDIKPGATGAFYFTSATDLNWEIQGAGDFNADQKPDIIWRNKVSGANGYWFMNGTNSVALSTGVINSVTDLNWKIRGANDFNGDGKSDLLWQNQTSGESAAWYMDSSTYLGGTYLTRIAGNTAWQSYGSYNFYEVNPTVTAGLAIDTAIGGTNTDLVTSNPTISGQVTGARVTSILKARLGTTQAFTNIITNLPTNGQFTLTRAQLQQLNGGIALADGTYTVQLQAQDINLNSSSINSLTFILDTKAATIGTALTLVASSDTGRSNTDRITSQKTPVISGTAETNSTVQLFDGALKVGQATASAVGAWQITTSLLADGSHSLTAKAADTAGNISAASTALSVTVDSQVAAPVSVKVAPASDTGSSNTDGITNQTKPTLMGTAEALALVTIKDGTTVLGTTTADATGAWQFTPINALTAGVHSITTTAVDVAGNTSIASTPLTVTIDTQAVAPVAVKISPTSDTGFSNTDGITNQVKPVLTGTAEALAVLTIKDGTTVLGTTTANTAGAWQFTPTIALTDGIHNITATAVDVAGNMSVASAPLAIKIDTQVTTPASVKVAIASDTGSSNADGITSQTKPVLTGTAEAFTLVTIKDGTTVLGTTTADATGAWQFTPTNALTEGMHSITTTAVDVAGNTSGASTPLVVKIDTQIAAPAGMKVAPTSDTGSSSTDGITNLTKPVLSGTAEALAVVTVKDGTTVLGATTANSTGAWQFTPTNMLTEGIHNITATAVDVAGNMSVVSAPLTVTIDTQVAAPVGMKVVNASNGSGIINQAKPTLTGTAEALAVVTIKDGTAVLGTAVANALGVWQFTPTNALTDGVYSLTATAVDVAGNISVASMPLTVIVDTMVFGLAQDTGVAGDRLTNITDLSAKVADAAGVALVELSVDGSSWQDITAERLANGTIALTAERLAAIGGKLLNNGSRAPLTNGLHNAILRTRNMAGNVTEKSLDWTIDTLAPGLDYRLQNLGGGRLKLSGTVTDLNGVQTLSYQVGTQAANALTLTNGEFSTEFTLTDTSVVTLRANDFAGNEKVQTATLSSTVIDMAAPVVTMQLANPMGPLATSDATLRGTVVDGTGIAKVTARVTPQGGTVGAWFDVTGAVQNSAFTITRGMLAGMTDGILADGKYQVELRAEDLMSNVSTPQVVQFWLDTAAPVLDVLSLYDGIAWEAGQTLAGTVTDGTGSGSQNSVSYGIFQGDLFIKGGAVAGGLMGGGFGGGFGDNLQGLTPGAYRLDVTAKDGANNQQLQSFQFLIADPDPKDDERLPNQPPVDPTPTPTSTDGNPVGVSSSGGGWGYVGPGGVWGTGSSGGGNGGGWSPSGTSGAGNLNSLPIVQGDGYDQDYLVGLQQVLQNAEKALSNVGEIGSKKAALTNREALLLDMGRRVQAGGFYGRMAPVLHGVFQHVYDPSNNSSPIPPEKVGTADAQYYTARPGISRAQALREGLHLAVDLAQDSLAVRTQVFQAALLTLVNEAFNPKLAGLSAVEYGKFAKAVLELGQVYARLAPTKDMSTDNWLDQLWQGVQLSDPSVISKIQQQGAFVSQFAQLPDPVQSFQFLARFLTAAANIVETRGDMKAATFIAKLVELDVEIAKVNPTVTAGTNDYSDWIENLIEGADATQVRAGVSSLFKGTTTGAERVHALDLGKKLLNTAQLLQDSGLQTQKKNASFLSQLLGLGGAYAALNPVAKPGDDSLNFFLDTADRSNNLQLAAQQLDSALQLVNNPGVTLFVNTERLRVLDKATPNLKEMTQNNVFIQKQWSVALQNDLFDVKDYKGIKYKQRDPKSLVNLKDFIDIVKKVENVYKDDTREQIITRIRRLYYPGYTGNPITDKINQTAFDQLLPKAPNYELAPSPVPYLPISDRSREVYRDELKDNAAFDVLTAHADENGTENPSPYLIFSERDEMVDIGHMLLTLEALLHPGSGYPYSGLGGYGIPTIDPASWAADIGIGSVWLTKQILKQKDDTAPQNLKLSSDTLSGGIPTKEEIDTFYNASAPEPDILGDVDGFGLFDKMRLGNNGQPLSQLLNEYYLPPDGLKFTSVKARWKTFSDDFQVNFSQGRIEGTFNVNNLTEEQKNQWISRIDKFNNLFGDGGLRAVTIVRRVDWTWNYTKAMFERFTTYVKEQLTNEKRTY